MSVKVSDTAFLRADHYRTASIYDAIVEADSCGRKMPTEHCAIVGLPDLPAHRHARAPPSQPEPCTNASIQAFLKPLIPAPFETPTGVTRCGPAYSQGMAPEKNGTWTCF